MTAVLYYDKRYSSFSKFTRKDIKFIYRYTRSTLILLLFFLMFVLHKPFYHYLCNRIAKTDCTRCKNHKTSFVFLARLLLSLQ